MPSLLGRLLGYKTQGLFKLPSSLHSNLSKAPQNVERISGWLRASNHMQPERVRFNKSYLQIVSTGAGGMTILPIISLS